MKAFNGIKKLKTKTSKIIAKALTKQKLKLNQVDLLNHEACIEMIHEFTNSNKKSSEVYEPERQSWYLAKYWLEFNWFALLFLLINSPTTIFYFVIWIVYDSTTFKKLVIWIVIHFLVIARAATISKCNFNNRKNVATNVMLFKFKTKVNYYRGWSDDVTKRKINFH